MIPRKSVIAAIRKPEESLTAVLQPVMRLSDLSLYGYEALIRACMYGETQSPYALLAAASHYGLDSYVEAAAIAREIDAAKMLQPIRLSVNVSARNLLSASIRDVMMDVPDNILIAIEITEFGLPLTPGGRVDVRKLARIAQEASDDYGCPILYDDITDTPSEFNLFGNMGAQGFFPDAIKVSNTSTKGLLGDCSTPEHRDAITLLLGAISLVRPELHNVFPSNTKRETTRLIIEGIENAEMLNTVRRQLSSQDPDIYGQGYLWPFLVGPLSSGHAELRSRLGIESGAKTLGLPPSAIFLEGGLATSIEQVFDYTMGPVGL